MLFPVFEISIHALCEEGDAEVGRPGCRVREFLSPPSARRATRPAATTASPTPRFLSTPSARRATQGVRVSFSWVRISIHALCEEGDRATIEAELTAKRFLSTPSARRATKGQKKVIGRYKFLSTPSARRATSSTPSWRPVWSRFLSTPSARRATYDEDMKLDELKISIHALCEEGDWRPAAGRCGSTDFYPRPLRGGRQQKQRQNLYFQTNYTTFCTNLEEL